jgi:hypothetical protein
LTNLSKMLGMGAGLSGRPVPKPNSQPLPFDQQMERLSVEQAAKPGGMTEDEAAKKLVDILTGKIGAAP